MTKYLVFFLKYYPNCVSILSKKRCRVVLLTKRTFFTIVIFCKCFGLCTLTSRDLFLKKGGTSKRYLSVSITMAIILYEIHIVLSSNFEFIRRIVDLNCLRTSDKFIQRIVHFYPLDHRL